MSKLAKANDLGGGVSQRLQGFEIYLKSERRSPRTIKTYKNFARRFLESLGDGSMFDEDDARTFLANHYEDAGNTARTIHYALAAFFASVKKPFNLNVPDSTAHPDQPTMPLELMPRIITTIKVQGASEEQGILALSSIYGMRCIELTRLGRGDVDFEKQTVTIRAKKGGRERVHLIPDAVMPYISNYDFKARCEKTLENIFWRIVRDKCGLELERRHGWHSIRRALYTGLRERGVDILLRHEFMRWRFRDSSMIDMIYERTPPTKIDKIVFSKHPFLGAWKCP